MIQCVQNGNLYEIRFRYDPVLISLIKNVPSKKWVPEQKMWTIHKDHLGWLIRELENTPYSEMLQIQSYEQINENAKLEPTTRIPNIDVSRIPFYVKEGAKPYQHQIDFMKFAIDRDQRGYRSGFLLCDDMGLGKSAEAANLALYNKAKYNMKHCLIICCVNSSKYNWMDDIKEHTRGQYIPYIVGARLKRGGRGVRYDTGSKEKLEDLITMRMYGKQDGQPLPYFIILNIEAIRMKEGKRAYPIKDRIVELVNSGEIGMICIDEVHKNMSPTSLQGKRILDIKKETGTQCMWIPITGTPIVKKPTDVYLPLKLIDGHAFRDFYTWCRNFCMYGGYGGHEIVGYKNIPHLKDMLQSNMIRRTKEDTLDMPEKVEFLQYVENTPYQQKLYQDVQSAVEADATNPQLGINPLAMFIRLRQVNGSPEIIDQNLDIDSQYVKKNAKLAKLLELLDDIHERGEKVLVFSNWVEPLRTLYKVVAQKYRVCCFTGTMSDADRQKHKHVFMTNPNYTVMLGTIGAMGTTHTLTAANNVIFYDEPWNPTDKSQAADRVYRIGQTKLVNVYTILTRDTVDERVHNVLYTKEGISNYLVDNKLDFRNHPELYSYLLSGETK